ncbi:IclR family transcriptional regulator domain-containing protein [Sodalis-like endosymbiont of Proechinophthirus fluctus]|uniref:IclR family transcriptional regulator domain-containing protein n=1 Tax=Sodalis-like endosymbiont of Proechinophthirus fluctus TaxID=1462730 RepID=UPI000AF74C74
MESFSATYLDKVESLNSVPTRKSWISKTLEFHITALDKVLLAWKSQEEIDYFLMCYF